jgi:hypothetical protein
MPTEVWITGAIILANLVLLPVLIGWGSGWWAMERRYRIERIPQGRRAGWCSGRLGLVSCRGILVVGGDDAYFYLALQRPWGFGCRPLAIPWERVRRVRAGEILWAPFFEFEILAGPRDRAIPMRLYRRGLGALEPYLDLLVREEAAGRRPPPPPLPYGS